MKLLKMLEVSHLLFRIHDTRTSSRGQRTENQFESTATVNHSNSPSRNISTIPKFPHSYGNSIFTASRKSPKKAQKCSINMKISSGINPINKN
jgi:hypothetical protein